MEKRLIALLSGITLACLMLSGCQNQSAVVSDLSSKIRLDSNGLVKFINSSVERVTDKAKNNVSVKVSWMFENIAGRTINILINVQFFDSANKLLYNQTKTLVNMAAGYKERGFSPANWVMYAGADAGKVDHVVITTTEIL